MAACRSFTSAFGPVGPKGCVVEVASSSDAARWADSARKRTLVTVGTLARSVPSWCSAAWSAAVRGGSDVTATTGIWDWLFEPMSGWARSAAWLLGALAGRNWLLSLFTWLPRGGRAWTANPVP